MKLKRHPMHMTILRNRKPDTTQMTKKIEREEKRGKKRKRQEKEKTKKSKTKQKTLRWGSLVLGQADKRQCSIIILFTGFASV